MKKVIDKLKSFIALTGWGPIVFAAAMFPFVVYLAACSSGSHSTSHPPKMGLLGRWQAKPTQDHLYALFEFFQDGTVVEGVFKPTTEGVFKPTTQKLRELSHWDQQCATGTYRYIDPDPMRVYIVLMVGFQECAYWTAGPWPELARPGRLYEVDWLDDDHVRLRSGRVFDLLRIPGATIELNRLN